MEAGGNADSAWRPVGGDEGETYAATWRRLVRGG